MIDCMTLYALTYDLNLNIHLTFNGLNLYSSLLFLCNVEPLDGTCASVPIPYALVFCGFNTFYTMYNYVVPRCFVKFYSCDASVYDGVGSVGLLFAFYDHAGDTEVHILDLTQKTGLGETDLNIRKHTSPTVGQNQAFFLDIIIKKSTFVWLRGKLVFAQSNIADTFILTFFV